MRPAVLVVAAALLAAATSHGAQDTSSQYVGWRYGPISGSATLRMTAPRLVCSPNTRNEKRIIAGTYRLSFTGYSRRRTRAAADISYNTAAGGPAGNTEAIGFQTRRMLDEVVHVRTVSSEDVCTLEERRCARSDTGRFGGANYELNVRMLPRERVRIYPHHPVCRASSGTACAASVRLGACRAGVS